MEASSAAAAAASWGFRCLGARALEAGGSAVPGSLLFGLGVAGNGLALALLWRHRRAARRRRQCAPPAPQRPRASAFYLLASALVATDLLGKCLLSPMVLAAYAKNRSLSALWPGDHGGEAPGGSPGSLCQLFAFLMAFFGLAPTALLLGMALECYLSLAQPYFYERHTSRRRGALLAGLAGALCALLCALPLLGFGAWAQYCPGTWCFVRLRGDGRAFALLYASLLGALGLALAAANLGTMRCLYRMALRQPPRHPWARKGRRRRKAFPGTGATEELAQLALLALMTALFAVCSLPVV
ncbi:prostaglandin D2 receptor-like, partial [Anolis carolinensis]|uniref:prostaglandin D2 receptor-like n=1 Tax=Anolis carolinensis TaxID=28377 RepID=UPI002F2B64BD